MAFSGEINAPATLLPRKEAPILFEDKAGWATETVWSVGGEENTCHSWQSGTVPRL